MKNNELKPRRWLLVVFIIIALVIVVILLNKLITDYNERKKNNPRGIIDVLQNQDNSIDKKIFNSKFEFYNGTINKNSVDVLLENIVTNNKKNKEHLIEVVFDDITTSDPEEIKNIKTNLDSESDYEVTLDYDKNNFVNKVTIEAKENENAKAMFNSQYEHSTGTKLGAFIPTILDEIITNNKTNNKHVITVVYNNTSTSNPEEIKNLKSSFEQWTNYEVSLDYDEKGYVNKIIIEK